MNRASKLIEPIKKKLIIPAIGLYYGIKNGSRKIDDALTIFVFHDVSEKPSKFSETYGLNVLPEIFEFQINFINNHFRLITPDELEKSSLPNRAALISFDDGFKSVFEYAIPFLEKLKIPSIVFLNMGPIKGELFWAGLICFLCSYQPDFKEFIIKRLGDRIAERQLFLSCSKDIVESYLNKKKEDLSQKVKEFTGPFANEEDLTVESKNNFLYYGNHLYNHYVPALMSENELIQEFIKNNDALNRFPNYRNMFSIPFGQPGSCFLQSQVKLLLDRGVQKVFSSSGKINFNKNTDFYDRIELSSSQNTEAKIWFQIYRRQIRKFN